MQYAGGRPFYILEDMDNLLKYIFGAVSGTVAFFAPIHPLILCASAFVAVDFVTGILASRKRARRAGRAWGIESRKAWNTVYKLCFVMAGIVLSWLIDSYVLGFMGLRLANLFTGFVCGVELWSYLENAAEISEHPVFRGLKRYMKSRVEDALNGSESEPGDM